MSIKDVLHESIAWGQAQVQEFASGVDPKERERPSSPEEWNPKDHLAHVAHWIASVVERTLKARLGEKLPEVEDIDDENERIYHQYSDHSWEEILAALDAGFEATQAIVDSLSEAELTDPAAAPWAGDRPLSVRLVGNTVLHPISHLAVQLQGRETGVELARRYERQAIPLLERIGGSGLWRGSLVYDAACYWALAGDQSHAIELLGEALQLAPSLMDFAKTDSDLDSLREQPAYRAIFKE